MAKGSVIRSIDKEGWNRVAAGWERWDEEVQRWLGPVSKAMLKAVSLKTGDVVLDVAAGSGEPGLTAASLVDGGRAVGVDLAEQMVDLANKNASRRGIDNYEAVVADAEALPFEGGLFDVALCRLGLMLVPDPLAALVEIGRVMAEGGRIAVAVWAEPERNNWATAANDAIAEATGVERQAADAPGMFRLCRPGQVYGFFEKAGFGDVKEEEVSGLRQFDSPGQYFNCTIDTSRTMSTALAGLEKETRVQAQRAVLDRARQSKSGASYNFDWCARVVSGRK